MADPGAGCCRVLLLRFLFDLCIIITVLSLNLSIYISLSFFSVSPSSLTIPSYLPMPINLSLTKKFLPKGSRAPLGPLLPPFEAMVWAVGVQPDQVVINNIQLLWYQIPFNMRNHGSRGTWPRSFRICIWGQKKVTCSHKITKSEVPYHFKKKFFPNFTAYALEPPWAPCMHHIPLG